MIHVHLKIWLSKGLKIEVRNKQSLIYYCCISSVPKLKQDLTISQCLLSSGSLPVLSPTWQNSCLFAKNLRCWKKYDLKEIFINLKSHLVDAIVALPRFSLSADAFSPPPHAISTAWKWLTVAFSPEQCLPSKRSCLTQEYALALSILEWPWPKIDWKTGVRFQPFTSRRK